MPLPARRLELLYQLVNAANQRFDGLLADMLRCDPVPVQGTESAAIRSALGCQNGGNKSFDVTRRDQLVMLEPGQRAGGLPLPSINNVFTCCQLLIQF